MKCDRACRMSMQSLEKKRKVSKYGVFSGLYFATFELHTETEYLSVLSLNAGKHQQEKYPYLNTFHAVRICRP